MGKYFQVAIDGPVGAGKSTAARELVKTTGFVYVDTGAMYRAVTLFGMRRGADLHDEEKMVKLAEGINIDVRLPSEGEHDGRLSTVLLNGEDVSWEIRTAEVSEVVATVAAMPKVREVLVPKQREISDRSDVVMEGRDITYVVLPEADLKIYLTAREAVRVERYYRMLRAKDETVTLSHARDILIERDRLDATRKSSPLKIVPDAWVLDTSGLSIAQVVELIAGRIVALRGTRD